MALLDAEASALSTRLEGVRPFALRDPMVAAATPSAQALAAIESHLDRGQAALRRMIADYRRWLRSPESTGVRITDAQRRLTYLRLRFNAALSEFDIFADVLTQRSEYVTGVWLGGIDALAADALRLPGHYYAAPAVVCYLDRGIGAAIRRARTRLPGGGANPVAIVRVPRERMVAGSGIGSSVCHEVGHQGSVLLDLINALRPELQAARRERGEPVVWRLYERSISEILADLWSVSRVGVGSTLGLMGVVSLPRAFVFRLAADDPHPAPWLRVKLSCAMGDALYPDPQWRRLASIWEEWYPLRGLRDDQQQMFVALQARMPAFIDMLVHHRPPSLRGESLRGVLADADRTPDRLRRSAAESGMTPDVLRHLPPTLAFALAGQARADRRLSPEGEGELVGALLDHWALKATLQATARAAASQAEPAGVALAT